MEPDKTNDSFSVISPYIGTMLSNPSKAKSGEDNSNRHTNLIKLNPFLTAPPSFSVLF